SGGIWRSTDGGETLAPASDDQADLSVAAIVFAPSDPAIVYAGMGGEFLGTGVLKSTDAGKSWQRIDESGLPPLAQTQRIAVDPHNPDIVLVAQSWRLREDENLDATNIYDSLDPSHLHQSLDGGRTWRRHLIAFPTDLAFDPHEPSRIYVAVPNQYTENKPPTLARSIDGGTTWDVVLNPPFDPMRTMFLKIAVTPAQRGRVYVYAYGSLGAFLFVSDDHGETWREQSLRGIRSRALLFEADPEKPDVLYFGQYVDLFRSTDGGATWSNLTQNRTAEGFAQYGLAKTHPDQFSIAFIPGTESEFLLGNDGGLYRSSEGAARFTHLNDTLSLTQIYGISAHPRRQGMLFIGTQDNGLQVRREDGRWKEFATGDFGRPWIDPLDDDRVCANYYFALIRCHTDYGSAFERIIAEPRTFEPDGDVSRIGFLAPLVGNGIDSTLYFGTWRFWTTTDLGRNWTAPAGDLDFTRGGFDVISEITTAPSNPMIIYTGSAEGRLMRTVDGGTSWADVSSGLPNRFITTIAVHPSDPNRVWVTFSGFRTSHVYGSDDGGMNWKDLHASLPDIPANALWIDPRHDGKQLLLGTDIGVFRTEDGGASWTPFNRGLPPVIVTDFARGLDGTLYAATHGRGVYAVTFESGPRRRPATRP
ncbi:MAG TPA: hypothetical protein VIL97_03025, partial [Thermoanaerobaculia bacterium]